MGPFTLGMIAALIAGGIPLAIVIWFVDAVIDGTLAKRRR